MLLLPVEQIFWSDAMVGILRPLFCLFYRRVACEWCYCPCFINVETNVGFASPSWGGDLGSSSGGLVSGLRVMWLHILSFFLCDLLHVHCQGLQIYFKWLTEQNVRLKYCCLKNHLWERAIMSALSSPPCPHPPLSVCSPSSRRNNEVWRQ